MLREFSRVRIRRLLLRRTVRREWLVVVIDYCSVSLDVIIIISIAITVAIRGTSSAATSASSAATSASSAASRYKRLAR
jgi:hypothetical protein